MINNAARSLLCEQFIANNTIDPKLYDRYVVKRGLRNSDGTGVMAGLTNICNVHGYVVNEGNFLFKVSLSSVDTTSMIWCPTLRRRTVLVMRR